MFPSLYVNTWDGTENGLHCKLAGLSYPYLLVPEILTSFFPWLHIPFRGKSRIKTFLTFLFLLSLFIFFCSEYLVKTSSPLEGVTKHGLWSRTCPCENTNSFLCVQACGSTVYVQFCMLWKITAWKKTLSVKGLKFWVKNSIICDTQLKPSVKAADLPG